MTPIGMSAADAGINLGGNFLTSGLNYLFSRSLAKYQNTLAMENWNTMNEYNSPSAQMDRFKAAGLNPNLIYGQGTPGNASSAPAADNVGRFQMDYARMELFEKAENLKVLQEQRKKLQSENEGIGIQNAYRQEQINQIRLSNLLRNVEKESLAVYLSDATGNGNDNFVQGLIDTYGEQYVQELRHTPWYYSYRNSHLSVDQASKRLSLWGQQEQFNDYRLGLRRTIDDLSNGDFNFSDSLRLILTLMLGNLSGNNLQ